MAVSKKRKSKHATTKGVRKTYAIPAKVKPPMSADILAYDTVVFDREDIDILAEKVVNPALGYEKGYDFDRKDMMLFVEKNAELLTQPSLKYFNIVTEKVPNPETGEVCELGMLFKSVNMVSTSKAILECIYYARTDKTCKGLFAVVLLYNSKAEEGNRFKFTEMYSAIPERDRQSFNFIPEEFIYAYSMVQVMLLNNLADEIEPKSQNSKQEGSLIDGIVSVSRYTAEGGKEGTLSEVTAPEGSTSNTTLSGSRNNVVYVGNKKTYRYRKGSLSKLKRKSIITCPIWGVRGHWRVYKKTGKKIWIEPYKKGKERNNSSNYATKTYKLKVDKGGV